LLNGAETYINSRLSFSLLGRCYQRAYQAMFGNAFGENSRNSNETGVFAGVECTPFKSIVLTGNVDVFSFPWLTYMADMPSTGRNFLLKVGFDPTDRLQMSLQYQNKRREENYADTNSTVNKLVFTVLGRFRYQLNYTVNDQFTLRSRCELSRYHSEFAGTSNGYYLGQDVELSPARLPVKFYLCYAMFDTDDYNSRIYVYENDLLYTYSILAVFDQGSRTYLMVKYSPVKRIDIWVKYGITQFVNGETNGSGLYEIQGNQRSEIKAQMIMTF
jgi:hypothetical protein